MKRKLLLLNALLAGLVVLGAAELYRRVVLAESRLAALPAAAATSGTADLAARATITPVRAADHLPIVERMLFSKDRNATVVVETVEPEAVKRPELPLLTGLVDFGDGPNALLAPDEKSAPEWFRVGQKVGEFVFTGVSDDQVTLSWNDQEFKVAPRRASEKRAAADDPRRTTGRQAAIQQQTEAPPREQPKSVGGRHNIGAEFIPGRYRADPSDDAPDGTEYQGYRKVVRPTPFGTQSWWEKK